MKSVASYAVLIVAGALFGLQPAFAQTLFKHVGPDGKITFSDQPPPQAAPARTARPAAATAAADPSTAAAGAGLPYELRQIAGRYPVTLYSGTNCTPCGSARAMLSSRGVPFTEKTVVSNEDIESLQRLSGDNALPFATIGGQQLKGYSETEWKQFLDAAGYPAQSLLPRNYRNPAPTPLVAKATPASAIASQAAAPQTASDPASTGPISVTPGRTSDNPAGIRF